MGRGMKRRVGRASYDLHLAPLGCYVTRVAQRNVIDALETRLAALAAAGAGASIDVRRDGKGFGDVAIFADWTPAEAADAAQVLGGWPEIAEAKASRQKLSIRLSDDALAARGAAVEGGDLRLDGLPAPRHPILIGFLGPNLSKALHVGHLRNVVVGHALTAIFKHAGFAARSYSLIGDIGRNVCEAMAGLRRFEREGGRPDPEEKPDQLIGRCYRDYLASAAAAPGPADAADPCAREHRPADDPADRLLQLWRGGDSGTLSLWRRVCAMVEEGHRQTLARLDIALDAGWRESDHVAAASDLVRRGVAAGVATRDETGMAFFDTGREEYRRIVLERSDGFPTEHGRVVAVFSRILAATPSCEHIDWNGTEWEPAQRALAAMMERLALIPSGCVHRPMFHGMVVIDGAELSSSHGEPLLVDDLLDRVRDSPDLARRLGTAGDDEIAPILIKSYLLCAPVTRPLVFSWERLMDPRANPGWTIARAWLRVRDARTTPGDAAALDADYRTALLQAESLPRHVRLAARNLRFSGLTSFLLKSSERLLVAPSSPHLARLSRTLLERTMQSLGFLPASKPS